MRERLVSYKNTIVDVGSWFYKSPFWSVFTILLGVVLTTTFAGAVMQVGIVAEPTIEFDVQKVDEAYNTGDNINGIDGFQWKSDYESYSIIVRNSGGREATDIRSTVKFHGCILGWKKGILGERIHFEPLAQSYITEGNASEGVDWCVREVYISSIGAGEEVTATVYTERYGRGYFANSSRNLIYDERISPKIRGNYNWDFMGHTDTEPMSGRVENANSSYVRSYLTFAGRYFQRDNFQRALIYTSRAYSLAPNDSSVQMRHGIVISKLGVKNENESFAEEGLELTKRATRSRPNNVSAWYFRGAAAANLFQLSDSTTEAQFRYCQAQTNLKIGNRHGKLPSAAWSLWEQLNESNPGVNCRLNITS